VRVLSWIYLIHCRLPLWLTISGLYLVVYKFPLLDGSVNFTFLFKWKLIILDDITPS